jgi:hypothetical protein
VNVDGVAEYTSAEFRLPLTAPGDRVIFGASPPCGLAGGDECITRKAEVDEVLQLLQAVSEAVLKYRHEPFP